MKSLDTKKVSEMSRIQRRKVEDIINAVQNGDIKSLQGLANSGIIGRTNMDKLYSFLINNSKDFENFGLPTLSNFLERE
jgi:hypothetical protein